MMNNKEKKAVALKYEPSTHQAPQIVAKGTGKIANNIIDRAIESEVNIYEDQNLVQLLDQLELYDQIPTELYTIIAEVFAFIYQVDHKAGEWKDDQRS